MSSPFERQIEALFDDSRGVDSLLDAVGVQHVASASERDDAALTLLRITPSTPHSATDQLMLQLARARADVIVTTGRILREEPSLRPQPSPEAAAWRRQRLGKPEPVAVAILTSGRDLPAAHPIFAMQTDVTLLTDRAGAEALEAQPFRRRPSVVALAPPSLRSAIDWLRDAGHAAISIEAGASSSADLYRDPVVVDELLLSIFEGDLDPALRAEALPSLAELRRLLPRVQVSDPVREAEGTWRFHRLRR